MSAQAVFRAVVQAAVLSLYDEADAAVREAESYAPDVAAKLRAARDIIFEARVQLDEDAE